MSSSSPNTIPIVDIGLVIDETLRDDDPAWIKISSQIDVALHSIGFVYLKNTGISEAIIDEAFTASKAFFTMDLQTKSHYAKKFEETPVGYDYYAGYTPPGAELEGDADYEHKESFDFCGNKRIYPDAHVPNLRNTINALEFQLKKLTLTMTRILAISLGVKDLSVFVQSVRHLTDSLVSNTTTLRTLYYPPVGHHNLTNHQNPTRCAAHTDYGFLTLLLMDPDAVGLEVKSTNEEWIPANPIPGTVLMNVADFLELWSDGRYPATYHRVCLPHKPELKSRCRQSIAYFVNPDDVVNVRALETKFGDKELPSRKENWNAADHIRERSRIAYSKTLT